MIRLRSVLLAVTITATGLAPALPAAAQYAPVPRAAPRTAVERQTLYDSRGADADADTGTRIAPIRTRMREISGPATVNDGDKLTIGKNQLRLFGIVAPQLSSSFGPQARAGLDALTTGQEIACKLRDRDREGRLLATCSNTAGDDLALAMLRRGLAVTARGSLTNSELSESYLAAEEAAQLQHLGMWSSAPPASQTINPSGNPSGNPPGVAAAAAAAASAVAPPPVVTLAPQTATLAAPPAAMPAPVSRQEEIARETTTAKALDALPAATIADLTAPEDNDMQPSPGFFERYQILIAGFLMLLTALSTIAAVFINRRNEKRESLSALAAALRGELLAMRAIAQTRIKLIASENDDRATSWPKLRSTLYQAYVGQLGTLGAELARQVASIYGQASDYATYYNAHEDSRSTATPKRQALQILTTYIDEVLPRLAGIEQTGLRPHSFTPPLQSFMPETTRSRVLPEAAMPRPVPAAPVITPVNAPVERAAPSPAAVAAKNEALRGALRETIRDNAALNAAAPAGAAQARPARQRSAIEAASLENMVPENRLPAASAAPPYQPGAPGKLWESLRHFARAQFGEKDAPAYDPDGIGDYASLIEQDAANLDFGSLDEFAEPVIVEPVAKKRGNGA